MPVRIEGRSTYSSLTAALVDARDGDTISLEPGTYNECVDVEHDVRISAKETGVRLVSPGGQPALTCLANVEVSGLEIVLEPSATPAGAVVVRHGSLSIERCTVRTAGIGVAALGEASTLHVRDCVFLAPTNTAAYYSGGARGTFEHNVISDGGTVGVWVVGAGSSVVIRENRIERMAKPGIQVDSGSSATIEGNVIEETGEGGLVFLDPETRVLTRRNTVRRSSGHGIAVKGCNQTEIEDNVIDASHCAGISVAAGATGVRLASNQITNSGEQGILVIGSAEAEIVGNRIDGAQRDGVVVGQTGSRAVIRENHIIRSEIAGVRVDVGGYALIENNDIDAATMYGVYVWGGGSTASVLGNRITNSLGHGVRVARGGDAELEGNTIDGIGNCGVLVDEAGSRVVIKECQILRTEGGPGVCVDGGGYALVERCDIDSHGHAILVQGAGSLAEVIENKLGSPIPRELPVQPIAGATRFVGQGDIPTVLVTRDGAAKVTRNRMRGGNMLLVHVTGSKLEAQNNVRETDGRNEPAGQVELFSEDIFETRATD